MRQDSRWAGRSFGPKAPGRVEEEEGEGAPSDEFRDFLDKQRAENSAEDAGEGAGENDFPFDGVEAPTSEGASEGDGDDECEGGADGDMVGDAAKEGEGGDDEGTSTDTETTRGKAGEESDGGVKKGAGGHGKDDSLGRGDWQAGSGRDSQACQMGRVRLT